MPTAFIGKAEALTTLETMNLNTLLEASSTAIGSLGITENTPAGQTLLWSGTYSDSRWTYSLSSGFNGKPLTLHYAGTLNGNVGQNIVVPFSANGTWGVAPLQISGQTNFGFDAAANDYVTFTFQQLVQIGSGTTFDWTTAAELFVGGQLGGGAGFLGGASLGPGGAIITGLAGALGGADAAVSLSSVFRDNPVQTPLPPPPPAIPDPPTSGELPGPGSGIDPRRFKSGIDPRRIGLVTGISKDGLALVQDSEFIAGNALFADGTIQGSFTIIPEPNTFVLLVLGLAGLLSYRCRISD
jgi:hypothetical protein